MSQLVTYIPYFSVNTHIHVFSTFTTCRDGSLEKGVMVPMCGAVPVVPSPGKPRAWAWKILRDPESSLDIAGHELPFNHIQPTIVAKSLSLFMRIPIEAIDATKKATKKCNHPCCCGWLLSGWLSSLSGLVLVFVSSCGCFHLLLVLSSLLLSLCCCCYYQLVFRILVSLILLVARRRILINNVTMLVIVLVVHNGYLRIPLIQAPTGLTNHY